MNRCITNSLLMCSVVLGLAFPLMLSGQNQAVAQPAAQTAPKADAPAISLFDGKSLDGWEGDEKMFRVEEGAIVAGTMKAPIKHNFFLASTKEFKNFDLSFKFILKGGKNANSGMMLRAQRVAAGKKNSHEMIGYQADMGDGWWGKLYDESRRDRVMAEADQKEMGKLIKKDDWNEYRVLCVGKRIQLWVNGKQTVDYTEQDDKITDNGKLGIQIHGGPAAEAFFKDIRVTELP